MIPKQLLSQEEQSYLNSLRTGDRQGLSLNTINLHDSSSASEYIDQYHQDQYFFKLFLGLNGHLFPGNSDLCLRISKRKLVDFLEFFHKKDCLLVTNCFGFTKHPKEGGRLVLINRGSFWKETHNALDTEIYGNFYHSNDNRGKAIYPTYKNLNLQQPISAKTADKYIDNFLSIFPNYGKSNVHGYLFAIKILLNILNNREFSSDDYLILRWGITTFTDYEPGNFCFIIHADNFKKNGFVIEFRDPNSVPPNSCPPKQPCNPPPPASE